MHTKRLAIPKRWPLPKKKYKFIVVPRAGKQKENSLALAVIIRDLIKGANTFNEAKKIIRGGFVEVNGKLVRDEKFPVSIFDRIFIKELNKYFLFYIREKGFLSIKEIDRERYERKICKIIGKKFLKGKKVQLNFSDGFNLLVEDKNKISEFKINDSIVLRLKDKKIEKILPLKKNATVFIMKGKNAGEIGRVFEIEKNKAMVEIGKIKREIHVKNLFVIEENEFK
ncbi:MAG: S4 domain-containing protein [Candidatus Pacearchaeota archaeon]